MAQTKRNQKIQVERLQTTLDKLGQLEEKPKQELTLRESIYFLRDKLKSALNKGYSYQDLSEILAEQEILISAATLKQYLTDISKQSSRKRNNKSKAKTKTKSAQSNATSAAKNVTLSKEESEPSSSAVAVDSNREIDSDRNQKTHKKSTSSSEVKTTLKPEASKSVKSQSTHNEPFKTRLEQLSDLDEDEELLKNFNLY